MAGPGGRATLNGHNNTQNNLQGSQTEISHKKKVLLFQIRVLVGPQARAIYWRRYFLGYIINKYRFMEQIIVLLSYFYFYFV